MTKDFVQVSGRDYRTVPSRLKQFREENPRASIKTEHITKEDGSAIFTTYILKDKADPNSADATGSAHYSKKEMESPKAFEKLETISVGRALSLLGYLNDGQVASSEEMEEFEDYKKQKELEAIEGAITTITAAESLESLKEIWTTLAPKTRVNQEVIEAKDKRKAELCK